MEIIKLFLLVLLGYLLGNFSISRIITAKKDKDITKSGSGNPGTMNMLRNYGFKLGIITLLCDAVKAAIPSLVGAFILFPTDEYLSTIALYVGGLSAIIGHMYPVFYNFRGGKGIACTVGMFAVANPLLALCVFVGAAIFFFIVRIGSLASMIFIISFATINTFISHIQFNYVAMIIMWFAVVIDVFAHRMNFIRLFANEERLINFKANADKDIEKVEDKKAEKLDELEEKVQELEEHYEEKLVKEQKKIEIKKLKSMKKVAKKKIKLQQRYNRQLQEMKHESNKIIADMQKTIDKKKAKEQEDKKDEADKD